MPSQSSGCILSLHWYVPLFKVQQAPFRSAQHCWSVDDSQTWPWINFEFGIKEHSTAVKSKQNPLTQHFPVFVFGVSQVFGQMNEEESSPLIAQTSPGKKVPLYFKHLSSEELIHLPFTQHAPSA